MGTTELKAGIASERKTVETKRRKSAEVCFQEVVQPLFIQNLHGIPRLGDYVVSNFLPALWHLLRPPRDQLYHFILSTCDTIAS